MGSSERQPPGSTDDRLAPQIVREVLQRLAERRLSPNPENFTWMYRQVMKARNLPLEVQYTSELVALKHALKAFEDLLVGNGWLAGRYRALVAITEDVSRSEADRIAHAHTIFDEIQANKTQALFQAARQVVEAREALRELVEQLAELSENVSGGRANFERALSLAEDCHDVDDVRAALKALAHDARKLDRAMTKRKSAVSTSYSCFAGSAPYVFGPPRG